MASIDWGLLARMQDQLAKTEDLRQRQRENHHKQLYKNELEQMIEERRRQTKTMEQLQRKQEQEQQRTTDNVAGITKQQIKFQNLIKQSANYNLSLGKEKKERIKSEIKEEKNVLKQKFKKVETEMTEEKEHYWQQKDRNKRKLAQFYDEQMNESLHKKQLERLENQKFQQMAQQLQAKKEQQRSKYINKIKYGYAQNPESYGLVEQIYKLKEQQKQDFINKFTISHNNDTTESRIQEKKHLATIEASNFNHYSFLERQLRKKQEHQKELMTENQTIAQIQQKLTSEQELNKERKKEQRKMLKTELEHQISEQHDNQLRFKRMSEHQSKLNKQLLSEEVKSLVPGLAKDYKDSKRQIIIDNFLRNAKQHFATQSLYPLEQ